LQRDHASVFIVDQVQIFLTSSLIIIQNSVAVSHTVYAHVGGPKNIGDTWAPPPGDGGAVDP